MPRSAKAVKLGPKVKIVMGDLAAPAFAGVEKVFVIAKGMDLHPLEANAFDAAKQGACGTSSTVGTRRRLAGVREHGARRMARRKRVPAAGARPGVDHPPARFFCLQHPHFQLIPQGGIFLSVGDGKDAPIDPFDIAAVAVKALTEPGHEGKTCEHTGRLRRGYWARSEMIRMEIRKLRAWRTVKLSLVA